MLTQELKVRKVALQTCRAHCRVDCVSANTAAAEGADSIKWTQSHSGEHCVHPTAKKKLLPAASLGHHIVILQRCVLPMQLETVSAAFRAQRLIIAQKHSEADEGERLTQQSKFRSRSRPTSRSHRRH